MLLDSTPGCHRAQNGHSLLELGFRARAVEEVGIISTKFTHLVKFMFLHKLQNRTSAMPVIYMFHLMVFIYNAGVFFSVKQRLYRNIERL